MAAPVTYFACYFFGGLVRQLSCLPAKLTRSNKVYINDDGWPADVRHPVVRRDFAL